MSGGNHIKRMDPCEHNGFVLVMTALDGWMDGWLNGRVAVLLRRQACKEAALGTLQGCPS
jgi:hypothetical protein